MSTDNPIFVVDAMLGNLAKKLRVLGYDAKYFSSIEDEKLVSIAKNEKRIILTKDELLSRSARNQGITAILIRGNDEFEQIRQIKTEIKLEKFVIDTNLSRCTICNGKLQPVEKYKIINKVPEGVLQEKKSFGCVRNVRKSTGKGLTLINFKNLLTN